MCQVHELEGWVHWTSIEIDVYEEIVLLNNDSESKVTSRTDQYYWQAHSADAFQMMVDMTAKQPSADTTWSTLFRTGTQWHGSSKCRKQAVCVKE